METFQNLIKNNLSGKRVLGLFILTNAVYILMLTITIPKTMAFSGGMDLLDMMPMGYDWTYVNELFKTLGEEGRHTYLTVQLPVDMLYPLHFGISYSLLLAYFLKVRQTLCPLFLCLYTTYSCRTGRLLGEFGDHNHVKKVSRIN